MDIVLAKTIFEERTERIPFLPKTPSPECQESKHLELFDIVSVDAAMLA